MKRIIYMTLAAALVAGCASRPTDRFQINGTIEGMDGEQIYLNYTVNDTVINDTAVIAGGKFAFNGTLSKPCQPAMIYMGDMADYSTVRYLQFYMEPTDMTVAIDTASFDHPTISGSYTQAQQDTLDAAIDAIRQECAWIYEAIKTETDVDKSYELREQLTPYTDRMKQAQLDFVKTHPDSYAVPLLMLSLKSDMTYEELKEVYDAIGDNVKATGDLQEVEEELAALARVQPGMPAPDFTAIDVNGDSIRFSEAVQGKYVLLDFWASWCVPCRKAMPQVKALYKQYKNKGFTVFCVGDNDSQPDKWREAIEQDGTGEFFHVLRGFKVISTSPYKFDRTHDLDYLYAVHYLPTQYLIDNEGKIIGKIENEEELAAKLKEIFQ